MEWNGIAWHSNGCILPSHITHSAFEKWHTKTLTSIQLNTETVTLNHLKRMYLTFIHIFNYFSHFPNRQKTHILTHTHTQINEKKRFLSKHLHIFLTSTTDAQSDMHKSICFYYKLTEDKFDA